MCEPGQSRPACAEPLDVGVGAGGANGVSWFARPGLASMRRMDAELVRRGYTLDAGGWTSEKVGGGMRHYRRLSK